MKRIINIVFLILSINIYSQSITIEDDELYIHYATEYKKLIKVGSPSMKLDSQLSEFNDKVRLVNIEGYYKSKNKERWLKRNISRTNFNSFKEAQSKYREIQILKELNTKNNNYIKELYDILLKKYDSKLIFETIKKEYLK